MSNSQQRSGQKPTDAATLRKRAEEQARTMEPISLSAQTPEAIEQMLHELRVHQLELEMQNEELRRAQTEIEAGRARYFDLYDLAPAGYCTLSETGLVLEANLTAATLLGVARSALIKQPISRFIFKEDQDIYYRHRKQLFETGEPQQCDLRLVKPDGTLIWAHLKGIAAQGVDGGPVCRVVLSDINERKRDEAELAESEQRYRTLADSGQVLIWTSGTNKQCDYFNQPWLAFTGRCFEQEVGDGWTEGVHPEDFNRCLTTYVTAFDRREPFSMEYRLRHCSGAYRWIQDDGTPRFDAKGRFLGYIGHCLDITDAKKAEAERVRLQTQLAHAQKMEAIGTLAGGIAHDFNNILGAVIGYTEMAREDSPPGSTLSRDLDRVLEAGNRAASLVKQILAFSRQQDSERVPLNPGLIVKEVVKLLRPSLPSTISINHRITANRNIFANPTELHQVLMNLATNAYHAMEQTGGSLDIKVDDIDCGDDDLAFHPEIAPGSFVRLSVTDTGPGIPPEIKDRIFDPYFTTKEVGKGTGMGLAIVDGIVHGCGGFITCSSEPGRETVFTIVLPAYNNDLIATGDGAEEIATGSGHILLVDDEEILIEMGQAILERLGYQVTTRTSSLEALATFQNDPHRFDAVITDQTMPGMTGLDLAQRLLQIRPELPVILCTGYSNLVDETQAKAYGIKGFAMKPLTKRELAALLMEALNEN